MIAKHMKQTARQAAPALRRLWDKGAVGRVCVYFRGGCYWPGRLPARSREHTTARVWIVLDTIWMALVRHEVA